VIAVCRRFDRALLHGLPFAVAAGVAACVAGAPSNTAQVPIRHAEPTQFLLVPVEVNGIPTTFFLDTGTAGSHVSRDFAEHVGLRDGALKLRSFRVGSIDAKAKAGPLRIADSTKCCTRYDASLTGSLGAPMWSTLDYVLDAKKPSLEVLPTLELAGAAGASTLRTSDQRIYIPVTVEGRIFEFLLDTGLSGARVTQDLIDELRQVNYDYVEVEITTGDVKEYKQFPALHAEVRLGDVHIPQFTFFVGDENAVGLNLLQYGALTVSSREGLFTFRGRE
jgi:hypothetical protein